MMHPQRTATESGRLLWLLGYININNQSCEMRMGCGPWNAHENIQCSNGNGRIHQTLFGFVICVIRVCISNDWPSSPVEVPFVLVRAEVVRPLARSASSARIIMARNTLQVKMVSVMADGTTNTACKIGPTRMSPAMMAARSMNMRVILDIFSSELRHKK